MELFKKLSESMEVGSTVVMTVAKSENGMTVSVLPGNSLVKDTAKNKFIPICMTGSPEEIDEGFIETALRPIARANGLLSNIKAFEESAKAAKDASEMEKKAKEEQRKLNSMFSDWLALSEKNYGEDKFKDALTCIGNAEKIADKVSGGQGKVDAMRKKIQEALGEGTMFGACTEDKSDGKNVKLNGSSKPAATSTTEKPAEKPAEGKAEEPAEEAAEESETSEEE